MLLIIWILFQSSSADVNFRLWKWKDFMFSWNPIDPQSSKYFLRPALSDQVKIAVLFHCQLHSSFVVNGISQLILIGGSYIGQYARIPLTGPFSYLVKILQCHSSIS